MCKREKSVKTSGRGRVWGDDNRRILVLLQALWLFSLVVPADERAAPELVDVVLVVEFEELEPFCRMVITCGEGERGSLLTFALFADAFPIGDEDNGEDTDIVTVLCGTDEDGILRDAVEESRMRCCWGTFGLVAVSFSSTERVVLLSRNLSLLIVRPISTPTTKFWFRGVYIGIKFSFHCHPLA
jgi:hypothetical protein